MVRGLVNWFVGEDKAVLNHPVFYLLSSTVEISISPVHECVASRLWLTSGKVCSCRSLSCEQ